MKTLVFVKLILLQATILCRIVHGQFNPSILQDTRDLPKLDGAYGFLYRTEDGISHGAKADPGGIVHGRFTYTDPTGLKVNFNYNAGSPVTPGYTYDNQIHNNYQQQPQQQQPQYEQQDQNVRRTKPPSLMNQNLYNQQQVQSNYQQVISNNNNNNALTQDDWQVWNQQQQLRHPLDIMQGQGSQSNRYF